jgi:hypothetical protein
MSRPEYPHLPEERQRAIHEAGHAVAALVQEISLDEISIVRMPGVSEGHVRPRAVLAQAPEYIRGRDGLWRPRTEAEANRWIKYQYRPRAELFILLAGGIAEDIYTETEHAPISRLPWWQMDDLTRARDHALRLTRRGQQRTDEASRRRALDRAGAYIEHDRLVMRGLLEAKWPLVLWIADAVQQHRTLRSEQIAQVVLAFKAEQNTEELPGA